MVKDLSHLPTSATVGRPPLPYPELGAELVSAWLTTINQEGRSRANPDKPWRASFASTRCDRALFYQMTDTPRVERSVADFWRMELGTMVHSTFEQVIAGLGDDAIQSEVVVDLDVLPGSAHADIIRRLPALEQPDGTVDEEVVDIKTINGFGFKRLVTTFNGPPEGPKYGHELQVASVVVQRNARQGRLVYLAMECLSPSMNKSGSDLGRFVGEWIIPRERCNELVAHEAKRVRRLLSVIDAGVLPTRTIDDPSGEYPAGAMFTDPNKGLWVVNDGDQIVNSGRCWYCDYCDFKDRCIEDGAGDSAKELF